MLRSLRRWLRKTAGIGLPFLPRTEGPSRFLEARFKDPHVSASSNEFLRPELGYRLYLPSGSSRRDGLPLIVMLHGCQQDPLSFAAGTRMNALAEERRCAVLYPEQSSHSNPMRCWNWFESASLEGNGEAALIAHLIGQVTRRRSIDPRRVFVVGMSAGGAMACLLSVRHSRLFAACAIHSGLMYGAASSPMEALAAMQTGPSAASIDTARQLLSAAGESQVIVPTLVIQGDRDTRVNPVNAGQIIEQLKARAECLDPAAGALIASGEQRIYRREDFTRQGRTVLRQVLVEGLGHAWSGGDARYEFNDAGGPVASQLILEFMMQYQREVPLVPAARK
jgi:poly(hydroxyalkanoate) depolymerase family esterase